MELSVSALGSRDELSLSLVESRGGSVFMRSSPTPQATHVRTLVGMRSRDAIDGTTVAFILLDSLAHWTRRACWVVGAAWRLDELHEGVEGGGDALAVC